jgi:hypothetical protein
MLLRTGPAATLSTPVLSAAFFVAPETAKRLSGVHYADPLGSDLRMA